MITHPKQYIQNILLIAYILLETIGQFIFSDGFTHLNICLQHGMQYSNSWSEFPKAGFLHTLYPLFTLEKRRSIIFFQIYSVHFQTLFKHRQKVVYFAIIKVTHDQSNSIRTLVFNTVYALQQRISSLCFVSTGWDLYHCNINIIEFPGKV